MDKQIKQNLRIFKSDLKTLQKLDTIPGFIIRLIEAKNVAEALGTLGNEGLYYNYQMHLRQLKDIGFFELTALERFQDIEYYSDLKELYLRLAPTILYEPQTERMGQIIEFKSYQSSK